jgi:dihydroxyacetone kinase-like protein
VDAVRRRGKSDVGAKTMLDVLVPVAEAWRQAGGPPWAGLRRVAEAARDATVPMRAHRGRASFLGERSVGHCDPGAASAALLVAAACGVLEGSA